MPAALCGVAAAVGPVLFLANRLFADDVDESLFPLRHSVFVCSRFCHWPFRGLHSSRSAIELLARFSFIGSLVGNELCLAVR